MEKLHQLEYEYAKLELDLMVKEAKHYNHYKAQGLTEKGVQSEFRASAEYVRIKTLLIELEFSINNERAKLHHENKHLPYFILKEIMKIGNSPVGKGNL